MSEPSEPPVMGTATLAILMLRADAEMKRVIQADGWLRSAKLVKDVADV